MKLLDFDMQEILFVFTIRIAKTSLLFKKDAYKLIFHWACNTFLVYRVISNVSSHDALQNISYEEETACKKNGAKVLLKSI